MSIPCGPIVSEILDQLNNPRGTADATMIRQVKDKVNEAYRDVAGSYNWNVLKNNTTISDSTFLVPADCRNIIQVIDEDQQPYNFLPGKNRQSNFNYNWYFDNPISTPLAEGVTLAVNEYDTTIASTAEFPATTCVGEYIRIGSNTGIYKIATWTSTSLMTLVDHFRGDQIDDGIFQIRPRQTQVLAFCDSSGDAITPSGVEVTYIRYPLPLYKDEDIIELPGYCTAVKVRALQKLLAMLGFNQAADRKQQEYLAALSEMKACEPSEPIVQPSSMFQDRKYAKGMGYIRGLNYLNGTNW